MAPLGQAPLNKVALLCAGSCNSPRTAGCSDIAASASRPFWWSIHEACWVAPISEGTLAARQLQEPRADRSAIGAASGPQGGLLQANKREVSSGPWHLSRRIAGVTLVAVFSDSFHAGEEIGATELRQGSGWRTSPSFCDIADACLQISESPRLHRNLRVRVWRPELHPIIEQACVAWAASRAKRKTVLA